MLGFATFHIKQLQLFSLYLFKVHILRNGVIWQNLRKEFRDHFQTALCIFKLPLLFAGHFTAISFDLFLVFIIYLHKSVQ
jgi:hypothetical protein